MNIKIAGVAVWIWAAGIALVIGGGWACLGNLSAKPTEDGLKCFENAKRMINAEHAAVVKAAVVEIYGGSHSDERVYELKREKVELARYKRAYDKTFARIKADESIFHKESSTIEKWLNEGRQEFKKIARTKKELDKNAEKIDLAWEIYMETDLVDLLR